MPTIQPVTGQPAHTPHGALPAGEFTRTASPAAHPLLTAVHMAIARGDDATLLGLLSRVPAPILNMGLGPQATPLLVDVAARTQNAARLEWLLRQLTDRGAHPSARDRNGDDALMTLLCRADQPLQAATLLLRRQAEVHRCNQRGLSPLHLLLLNWQGEAQVVVLNMLLRRGADMHQPTPRGKTPLWLAASTPQGVPLVEALLQACPPRDRAAFVRAQSRSPAGERGHAGTAALLHLEDDALVEEMLVLLARHGLHPMEAARQASELLNTRTVDRSFQGIQDRASRALTLCRADRAAAAPLQAAAFAPQQAPRIMLEAPTVEAAAPQLLVRPLPLVPQAIVPPQAISTTPSSAPAVSMPVRREHSPLPSFQRLRLSPGTPEVPFTPPPVIQAWPQEPSSVDAAPLPRALYVANPEPPTRVPTTVLDVPAKLPPVQATQAVAAQASYETLSLHEVARSGPIEAFASVLALNPQALTTRDRLKNGGHMPLTLAVMSRDKRHVTLILEALQTAGSLTQEMLDAAGTDGRCALAVAIDLNGQHQAQALLRAGASPLLPVPQNKRGITQAFRGWVGAKPSSDAAEYAVRVGRPYILTLLLQWDEQQTVQNRRRPLKFDLDTLTALAQSQGAKTYTPTLRAALEDAAARRQQLRAKRNLAAKP